MRYASLAQKFHFGLIFCASALAAITAPAAHAANAGNDASIVVPDEPDDDGFNPTAQAPGEDSEARAIFQAWRRLDTGLTANIGVSVPSRRPIEKRCRGGAMPGRSRGLRCPRRVPARSG